MSKIKSLFKKAWTAVTNPGQDERVEAVIAAFGRELIAKKGEFNLENALQNVDCNETDIVVASKEYYQRLLQLYWSKGIPPQEKRNLLAFLGSRLRIDKAEIEKMNQGAAAIYFGARLGASLEDGVVSDEELKELESIANVVKLTVPQFIQKHMLSEGVGLFRGLFADAIEDGHIEPEVWENLLSSASKLGLAESQLQSAVMPMATTFAEHVLADSKSENLLTDEDEQYLRWIIKTFKFDETYSRYLRDSVAHLKLQRELELEAMAEREKILRGELDTIDPPAGINLKSGELLYFCQDACAQYKTIRSDGFVQHRHFGRLLLTDSRIVFESSTKPMTFAYRSLIAWRTTTNSVITQVSNKPEVEFALPAGSERFLQDKVKAIVELHSRVLRRKVEGKVDRHISQDVRQRVWQKYGGKCAECGAQEYLEFDHIIPVAKGGGNQEQNIQILCRKCNLSKSDKI